MLKLIQVGLLLFFLIDFKSVSYLIYIIFKGFDSVFYLV